jgi:hypothetical protein
MRTMNKLSPQSKRNDTPWRRKLIQTKEHTYRIQSVMPSILKFLIRQLKPIGALGILVVS